MDEKRKRVDAFMDAHFRLTEGEQANYGRLYESMRYSLLAGGKRVRPVLLLAAYEACSPTGDDVRDRVALAAAASLELIHTYSLIHDDLPAMDNDDLRRGRPTNHKVFGDAFAILAGDSLLTEAFLLIARSPYGGVDPKILLEVIGDIAEASGAKGMAGGQVLDLESERKKITREALETVHRHKTGCLILVSVTSGAKLAGVSGERLKAMETYGRNIGLAFQIADDILDVEGGAEEMGKATGGDAKKEKSTYPSILGMAESKRLAQDVMQKAVDALSIFDEKADYLRELARFIVNRKN